MKTTLIDTSFVVAIVNRLDEFHEKALKLSVELDRQQMVVTDAVLLEIGNAFSRRYKQDCIVTVEGFLKSKEVEIVRLDETLFDKAFEFYKAHTDKTYGLVDCISFVVMQEHGITDALTHDRHFVQAGFRALMRDPVN